MSATLPIKEGPAVAANLHEVRGVFRAEAPLQDAIGRLMQAGFDRADISLPQAWPSLHSDTPEQGAADPDTPQDRQQLRTLGTSMAGSVSAVAAAAVVVATGGTVLPALAAAAAAGLIVGGGTSLAGNVAAQEGLDERAKSAERGELVLSVRAPGPDDRERAEAVMWAAGAESISAR